MFKEEVFYKSVTKKSNRVVETGENSRVVELEMNSGDAQVETNIEENVDTVDDPNSSGSDENTKVVSDEDDTDESPVLQDYMLARDRVRREIHVPLRFTENHCVVSCLLTTNDGESFEPCDYADARRDKD